VPGGAVSRVVLAVAALAIAIARPAAAAPKTPAQVLAAVEATYRKPAQLIAHFDQTVRYAATGVVKHSGGTLWVARPGKIRFDYAGKKRAVDRQFLFDGKALWVIDHANLQVATRAVQTSDLPAVVTFFTGAGSLTKDFTVGAASTSRRVPGATVLRLTPNKPSAAYAELYLVVDPASSTVTSTIVVDSSGNTNTFAFSKVDTRTAVGSRTFWLDPKAIRGYKLLATFKP